MLTLRLIDPNDYEVREAGQRIGRIRYARERTPAVWLWHVQVHVEGVKPMGTAKTLDEAKAAFRPAWEALKKRVGPEALMEAYKAMNIRRRE